jgi:hypothetical protein
MPDRDTWDILLEHESRCWDAERENAERLNNRTKLMSAIAIGVIGVGFYKFDWVYDPQQVSRFGIGWGLFFVRILVSVALLCWSISLWLAMRLSRPRRKPHASHYMFFNSRMIQGPPRALDIAAATALSKLHRASLSLMLRNLRLDVRLRWSMRWFFIGTFIAIITILVSIWFSVPPTIADEGNSHNERTSPTNSLRERLHPAKRIPSVEGREAGSGTSGQLVAPSVPRSIALSPASRPTTHLQQPPEKAKQKLP